MDFTTRLPFELWLEVFWHCLPTAPTEYVDPRPTSAPMLLWQVCRTWQDMTLSCPRLWASIRLRLELSRPAAYALADKWIARSENAPLSFSIMSRLDDPSFSRNMFELFVPHAQRWKDVSGTLRTRDLPILAEVRATPVLETLSLGRDLASQPLRESDMLGPPLQWLQKSAPRLEAIEATGILLLLVTFPWAQLRRLTMLSPSSGLSLQGCLGLLRQCPYLQEAHMFIEGPDDGSGEPVVSLAHLTRFKLTTRSISSYPIFCNKLRFPSLEHLHIRSVPSVPIISSPLRLLMSVCAKTLTSLVLPFLAFQTEAELLSVLQETKNLHILDLGCDAIPADPGDGGGYRRGTVPITSAVLLALVDEREDRCLLPTLAFLTIKNCIGDFDDVIFADFLRWRLRMPANVPRASAMHAAPLEKLYVRVTRRLSSSAHDHRPFFESLNQHAQLHVEYKNLVP